MRLVLILLFALFGVLICCTNSQDSKLGILVEDTEDFHGVKAASQEVNNLVSESMYYRELYKVIHEGDTEWFRRVMDQEIFRQLDVSSFFDINRQGSFQGKLKKSALHIACEANHVEIAKILIEMGANLELKDDTLFTPLMVAASSGYIELSRVLMESGAKVDATGYHGISPILMATKGRHKRIVEDLIFHKVDVNTVNDENISALIIAAGAGELDLVELLVSAGADVNLREISNNTALSWAIFQTQEEVVRYLLQNGASESISYMNAYGMKCIHLATVKNNTSILQMLLDNGANISDVNKEGKTALHFAAEIRNMEGIAEFLIEKGIDIGVIWEKGIEKMPYTAYDVANGKSHEKITKLIEDREVLLKLKDMTKNDEL